MHNRHRQTATVARPVGAPSQGTGSRPVEKPVDFNLAMPQAHSVTLAGTFNNWDTDRTPLRKDTGGEWKTTIWLPKGRYEYRFVVDGQWMSDPKAKGDIANPFGTNNSVLIV